jgi:hypothetical protein
MPKRVSLKGRGADIFFGDGAPPTGPPNDPSPPAEAMAPESPPTSPPREKPASQRLDTSVRARVHARTDAGTQAHGEAGTDAAASERVRLAMRDELHRKLQQKHRLASYTFRFRPDELDQLEGVLGKLERGDGQKPSKNDVVRLALLWLLADYEEHRDASVLAQVLARG